MMCHILITFAISCADIFKFCLTRIRDSIKRDVKYFLVKHIWNDLATAYLAVLAASAEERWEKVFQGLGPWLPASVVEEQTRMASWGSFLEQECVLTLHTCYPEEFLVVLEVGVKEEDFLEELLTACRGGRKLWTTVFQLQLNCKVRYLILKLFDAPFDLEGSQQLRNTARGFGYQFLNCRNGAQ